MDTKQQGGSTWTTLVEPVEIVLAVSPALAVAADLRPGGATDGSAEPGADVQGFVHTIDRELAETLTDIEVTWERKRTTLSSRSSCGDGRADEGWDDT